MINRFLLSVVLGLAAGAAEWKIETIAGNAISPAAAGSFCSCGVSGLRMKAPHAPSAPDCMPRAATFCRSDDRLTTMSSPSTR